MIAGIILLLSVGMIVCFPSSGKVYYKAAEGDIVNVNYQRYEFVSGVKVEQDGGQLVVYLSDDTVPLGLQDQYPDAITVVPGFWRIIAGGTTTARDYGDGMQEGDKKEGQHVPAADGYTSSSHELYGESLYFDVELLSIFYDANEQPFGTEQSDDPWGLEDFLNLPFVMPILVLIGLAVLSAIGYKLHGQTRRFLRGRVHCSCGAVATMECARCFTKSCRDCFLKHSGCHKCGSNKMVPLK
jgi:hypothetical protein